MVIKKRGLTQRQKKSQKTCDKIFKTAIDLFAKYGYENVTIDDITMHSGVSKGSFYTHFKSKEHIMLVKFQEIDNHYKRWFETFSHEKSASLQLVSFAVSVAFFVRSDLGLDMLKVVYSSQISLSLSSPKLLADEARPYYGIIGSIIKLGIEQGEFRDDTSVLQLTRIVGRLIRGLLYDWCLFESAFDLEEEAQNFFTLILDGLKKQESKNPSSYEAELLEINNQKRVIQKNLCKPPRAG